MLKGVVEEVCALHEEVGISLKDKKHKKEPNGNARNESCRRGNKIPRGSCCRPDAAGRGLVSERQVPSVEALQTETQERRKECKVISQTCEISGVIPSCLPYM